MILTLMLSGRAMTIPFIARAGGSAPGDPPAAWLMPLTGDAVIGVGGLFIAWLIWKRKGLFAWSAVVVWNAIGIWDALSAFMLHLTAPWPDFFMIRIFGASMFFAASALHLAALWLASRSDVVRHFFKA
ncbi:MAG: hypothetical protein KGM93_15330 [Sphingomonadales bacterium]|nr:hypothetical protein [Sphingomonadales bacterium]